MKKTLLLVFQVFLLTQLAISDEDLCTSQFEDIKSSLCAQLSTDEQTCFLIDNECKNWYKGCSEYNPESNFDDNVCTRIIPTDKFKKCKVETAADGKKTCTEILKACSEFTDKTTCVQQDLGNDRRCIFINGQCEEHYNSCSGLDNSKCSQNIPSSNTQKCVWKDDTTGCKEETRQCADYIVYSEKNQVNLPCNLHQFTMGTSNRICALDGDKCVEMYESCGKAPNEDACKNNLPLYNNAVDEGLKCVWESNKCIAKKRLCSEYKIKVNNYTPNNCYRLSPEKESRYSVCILDEENDKCEEVANNCNNYNSLFAENERTEEGCQSSLSDEGYKCTLVDKECTKVEIQKECGDLTSKNECLAYNLKKEGKKCVFKNNKCIEEYKNCEAYNTLVSETDRKKEDCESIYSYKEGSRVYKCVFSSDSKKCERKEGRECSDYTGSDAEECELYPTQVQNHACTYDKNSCVDKINFVYSFCYEYNGNDKSICEAIQPRQSNNIWYLDPDYKCVLEENEGSFTCVQKPKECKDAKDARECTGIIISKENKRCVYFKNDCIEQYKTCEAYQDSEDVLDKDTCESIISVDADSNNVISTKCVYTAGVGGNKGTCKTTPRTCSDFNIGVLYDKCLNLNSYNKYTDVTQCTFSDNVCKTEMDSCLGLHHSLYATEENCKNAKTSSPNLKCDYLPKDEHYRKCIEVNNKDAQLNYVEKEEEEQTETTGTTGKTEEKAEIDPNDDNEEDDGNNAGEKYLNKILLILLTALF